MSMAINWIILLFFLSFIFSFRIIIIRAIAVAHGIWENLIDYEKR